MTNNGTNYGEQSLKAREQSGGQIYTGMKGVLDTQEKLSTFYSPGIAEPCRVIAKDKAASKRLTIRKNTIAVISDGSAVLGLGNIGPEAAMPVMEGKSMLLKHFADVDAIPLVLDTQDTDELVETITRLAPSFGGINLEDISAPRCFEIQERLAAKLDIPVFHDDQDGTAIVTLAGLTNALKVQNKTKEEVQVVISGAGAAGIAIIKLLKEAGFKNIKMVDSRGIVSCDREDINDIKREYCTFEAGTLADAMKGSDIFIGVSKGGLVTKEMVESMNANPIIFAMANPTPEIMPEEAHKVEGVIIGTGRSDYPNQINNVLVFPGFFRGLLDGGLVQVTTAMKLKAAEALASFVPNPTADKVIPSPFEEGIAEAVAKAVQEA